MHPWVICRRRARLNGLSIRVPLNSTCSTSALRDWHAECRICCNDWRYSQNSDVTVFLAYQQKGVLRFDRTRRVPRRRGAEKHKTKRIGEVRVSSYTDKGAEWVESAESYRAREISRELRELSGLCRLLCDSAGPARALSLTNQDPAGCGEG